MIFNIIYKSEQNYLRISTDPKISQLQDACYGHTYNGRHFGNASQITFCLTVLEINIHYSIQVIRIIKITSYKRKVLSKKL